MPVASSKRSFSGVGVSSFSPESGRRIRDGMRLKSHAPRLGALLPRPAHDFAQHRRVRAMHSVEVADAHAERGQIRRERLRVCEKSASVYVVRVVARTQIAQTSHEVAANARSSRAGAPAPHNLNLKLQFHSVIGKRTWGGSEALVASCGRSWQM